MKRRVCVAERNTHLMACRDTNLKPAAAAIALALLAATALYISGYFCLGYVATLCHSRLRFYRTNWIATTYEPMAKAESLITGLSVKPIRDVCGTGYVMSRTSCRAPAP